MFRAEQKIMTAKFFTASQWHIFRAVLLCVLFLLTLILTRGNGNIVDELAVSVVCTNNMVPMPALLETLNLAADPCSSGVIKHLPLLIHSSSGDRGECLQMSACISYSSPT